MMVVVLKESELSEKLSSEVLVLQNRAVAPLLHGFSLEDVARRVVSRIRTACSGKSNPRLLRELGSSYAATQLVAAEHKQLR